MPRNILEIALVLGGAYASGKIVDMLPAEIKSLGKLPLAAIAAALSWYVEDKFGEVGKMLSDFLLGVAAGIVADPEPGAVTYEELPVIA